MLLVWYVVLFLLGAGVGNFLSVCIARIPYEKSILWPGSRCDRCLQPQRWYDRLPLVGYLIIRGRCRSCGAPVPLRDSLVELLTGLTFLGLFHLEIVGNVMQLPLLDQLRQDVARGIIPARAWVVFGYHALLASFLIITSFCDIEHLEIPLPVTIFGTMCGLVGATLFPWPFPSTAAPVPGPNLDQPLPLGLYPWPVWYPLPAWLPPCSWRLGLATGVAGALAGMLSVRVVRTCYSFGRGMEAMGLGDSDLMMMAGSFLGWQPILLAFFVAVIPGFAFALVQLFRQGNQMFPFGPSLGIGALLTPWLWHWIDIPYQALFFEGWFLGVLAVFGPCFLLVSGFALRLFSGGKGVGVKG